MQVLAQGDENPGFKYQYSETGHLMADQNYRPYTTNNDLRKRKPLKNRNKAKSMSKGLYLTGEKEKKRIQSSLDRYDPHGLLSRNIFDKKKKPSKPEYNHGIYHPREREPPKSDRAENPHARSRPSINFPVKTPTISGAEDPERGYVWSPGKYAWLYGKWTDCSLECGQGTVKPS